MTNTSKSAVAEMIDDALLAAECERMADMQERLYDLVRDFEDRGYPQHEIKKILRDQLQQIWEP